MTSTTTASSIADRMPNKLSYITSATLRTWLDIDPAGVAIVDVRDSDFIGGHIVNAINIPADKFELSLANLEEKIASKPKVVFHCMLSQQRGPTCAASYARALTNKGTINQEVYVLTGGFNEWARKYGTNTKYTQDFQPDLF